MFWIHSVLNTSCVNETSYLNTIAKMLCNINVADLKTSSIHQASGLVA